MTMQLTIGVDPGLKGAHVCLRDGEPWVIEDMPTIITNLKTGAEATNHRCLAERFKCYRHMNPGAHIFAVVEQQIALQSEAPQRSLKTGAGFGMILGVLAGLGIDHCVVTSQRWKKHFNLLGTEKDQSRIYCVQRWPEKVGMYMTAKKHNGRSDALLIARYAYETEAWIK